MPFAWRLQRVGGFMSPRCSRRFGLCGRTNAACGADTSRLHGRREQCPIGRCPVGAGVLSPHREVRDSHVVRGLGMNTAMTALIGRERFDAGRGPTEGWGRSW